MSVDDILSNDTKNDQLLHPPNKLSPRIPLSISKLKTTPKYLRRYGTRKNKLRRQSLLSIASAAMIETSKDLSRTMKNADKELRNEFRTFANTTSAHGVPLVCLTSNFFPFIELKFV